MTPSLDPRGGARRFLGAVGGQNACGLVDRLCVAPPLFDLHEACLCNHKGLEGSEDHVGGCAAGLESGWLDATPTRIRSSGLGFSRPWRGRHPVAQEGKVGAFGRGQTPSQSLRRWRVAHKSTRAPLTSTHRALLCCSAQGHACRYCRKWDEPLPWCFTEPTSAAGALWEMEIQKTPRQKC